MKAAQLTLPIIVFSQFCCTSLWFAGNGVLSDLVLQFSLPSSALGHITAAVQFGFIIGTLSFAVLTVVDRYSPSRVFMGSALFGALFNLGLIWEDNSLNSIVLFRFLTGFFLAGIYPVGMKIAADYFDKSLGKSLGFLVGALVVGTAFPHLLKGIIEGFEWQTIIVFISLLALVGGLFMVVLIPDGPYRKASKGFDLSAFLQVFKNPTFRASAFGYFGHMWELYAFWAFLPILLQLYAMQYPETSFNIPTLSFLVIAGGGIACVVAGFVSQFVGVKRTASFALSLSGACCLICPLMFWLNSEVVFLFFLFVWGMAVIADSPLFSTLVAQNAPAEIKGTALTIVNSIGFLVTIVSIQMLNSLQLLTDSKFIFSLLAIGPVLGLIALWRKGTNS